MDTLDLLKLDLTEVEMRLKRDYPDPAERTKARAQILQRAFDRVRAKYPHLFPPFLGRDGN